MTAIDFLKMVRPLGPWTLYAMEPDDPVKETKTFGPGEDGLIDQFIQKHINKANLYWLVNPTKEFVTKNPEKDLIDRVEYLFVDVDPDCNKDFTEERKRIKELLEGRQNPPTILIDSGGGMQALWKLDKPIKVIAQGDASNISEIEAYNRQLEREYAADHCHNINRLLRLPFTVNHPSPIKRKRGRVKADTGLVLFDESRVYSLNNFIRAEIVSSNTPLGSCEIIDFGQVRSIDVDTLTMLSTDFRHVIINGNTSDNRYKGRSEAMFAAVRHMIRQGCSDVTIASVLLDKAYKISAHIYDQRNPQEYTKRQIAKAKTAENEKNGVALIEMNDRFCVAQDGSKTWIFSEEFDAELDQPYMKRQAWNDFQQYWANRSIDIETDKGVKQTPLAKWWFSHPRSRRFEQVIFLPNRDIPNTLNLWRGFNVEPRKGDWSAYMHHIEKVVCNNNPEHVEYLLNWMARAVQHPEHQGYVAVVLRGPRGSGKGKFASMFGYLFGRHFKHVSNPRHVTGNFNAHLRECVVLLADEAFFAGDKASESVMKTLITEQVIPIEAKHVDVREARNCVHMICCSNQEWVVPAGELERRFFVLDVDSEHNQDTVYFDALEKAMEAGGYEAMLHDLMTRDISGFNVFKVPKSKALYEQQLLTLGPETSWWYEKLKEGQVLPTHLAWGDAVSQRMVLEDYQDKANAMGFRYKKITLDNFFAKVMPTKVPPTRVRREISHFEDGEHKKINETFLLFPSLNDCRAQFCRHIGIETMAWPSEVPLLKPQDTREIPF